MTIPSTFRDLSVFLKVLLAKFKHFFALIASLKVLIEAALDETIQVKKEIVNKYGSGCGAQFG